MKLNSKLLLGALFLALTLPMRAQEKVFTNLNFALTPPDDWTPITNITKLPGIFTVSYIAPEGGRMLTLRTDSSRTPTGPMNDKFIEDFEKGAEQNGGGKRISGKFIEMDGVKAYERIANRPLAGRQMSSLMHAVLTSERFYDIEAIALKNAQDDPEIQKALASFRFLTPEHEPRESAQAMGYRVGYMIGRYLIPIASGAVALAFIILVIVKSQRSKPPPLPPMA